MPTLVKPAIDRCLDIVSLLAEQVTPQPLGTIAEALDVPKSAAHRLLARLVDRGWVRQEASTGFYGLTLRLTLLGQRFLHGTRLPHLYQPLLESLAQRTGTFVRLAVAEGERLSWITEVQGAKGGLIYQPEMTTEIRLNVTATGKAWLATMADERAIALVLAQGFGGPPQFGPRAITTIEPFLAELQRTRERGYGLAIDEGEAGVGVVAAVIREGEGAPALGTVSAAAPLVRLPPERIAELARAVCETAAELSVLWPLGDARRAERATARQERRSM